MRTFGGTDTKYHVRGPSWALIVWGFKVIRGLGTVAGIALPGDLYPRCLRWKFLRSLECTTEDELYTLFDDEQSMLENLIPFPREHETVWFRSVQVFVSRPNFAK